jgi:hypothetical protein
MISSTAFSEASIERARDPSSAPPARSSSVERLQQVVTRGSEEPGLVAVGGIRLLACRVELGVDPHEGRSALLNSPLEGSLRLLQCRLGEHACRHIREADDDPAIGQARGIDLEDLSLFSNTL